MSTKFNLDEAIVRWLKSLRKHRAFSDGMIRELEVHLRDHIDDIVASGVTKEEAFNRAVRSFGDLTPMAKEEYENLRPGIGSNSIINTAMLKNYIKITLRNYWNQKFYAFINVFGLTMGFTIVFMIGMFVNDELSFDKFHANNDNLYRVVENQYYAGQPVFPVAVTPTALGPAMVNEYPEVVNFTRFQGTNINRFKVGDKELLEDDGVLADANFFDMFSFKILEGSIADFRAKNKSMVINEELAKKYFLNQSPIGQTVNIDNQEFEIVAVIEDVPHSSHLTYRYFINFENYLAEDPQRANSWGSNWLYTYVQLKDGTNYTDLNTKITGLIKTKNEGSVTDIYLQPLEDIYLGEVDFVVEVSRKGELMYVKMFSLVAIFILIISCINFMNLSTARAAKRAKEVGLRKTIGAQRSQLIWQFMSESTFLTMVSVLLSFGIIAVLLPSFNEIADKNFELQSLFSFSNEGGKLVGLLLIIVFITGIVAGSYPALYLSGMQPITSLNKSKSKGKKGASLRKALVVFQFVISVVLIVGTLVIYKQLQYIQNADIGFNRQNILYSFIDQKRAVEFANQLRTESDIVEVGLSNSHPAYVLSSTSGVSWPGKNPDDMILFHNMGSDGNYIELMEMTILEGRNFSDTDSTSVLLNEQAVAAMKMTNPIGQIISYGSNEVKVIGVVKDFNFKSIHTPIEPLIIYHVNTASRVYIRFKPGSEESIISTVESSWKKIVPERELDYYFLEDDFADLYQAEDRTKILSSYFAIFAVLISCLGLFGLVSYAAEQRTKEVGIRKVLGASTNNLFVLLTADFTKLVIISLLFSLPIGWYAMNSWLNNFAYRIDLSIGVFVLAAALALIIALITVSYQTIKVSVNNPVNALRNE